MILETNSEKFMLQIRNFVYDYKIDKGVEKIIVASVFNINYYSIYSVVNDNLILSFTNMSNSDIGKYMSDLGNNYRFIIKDGRGGI